MSPAKEKICFELKFYYNWISTQFGGRTDWKHTMRGALFLQLLSNWTVRLKFHLYSSSNSHCFPHHHHRRIPMMKHRKQSLVVAHASKNRTRQSSTSMRWLARRGTPLSGSHPTHCAVSCGASRTDLASRLSTRSQRSPFRIGTSPSTPARNCRQSTRNRQKWCVFVTSPPSTCLMGIARDDTFDMGRRESQCHHLPHTPWNQQWDIYWRFHRASDIRLMGQWASGNRSDIQGFHHIHTYNPFRRQMDSIRPPRAQYSPVSSRPGIWALC